MACPLRRCRAGRGAPPSFAKAFHERACLRVKTSVRLCRRLRTMHRGADKSNEEGEQGGGGPCYTSL